MNYVVDAWTLRIRENEKSEVYARHISIYNGLELALLAKKEI